MKEQMIYVAIDADDVGKKIGEAVLQNDTDGLSQMSQNINSGVKAFSQWAEFQGGSVISSGSDEAIVQIPASSLEELEDVKVAYQKETGFSVSIGIGEQVSEAAKALIYAKMNGKNQIIDYTPEMEEAMKQAISGDLQEDTVEEEGVPEHEQHLDEEGKKVHDDTELESDEEEIEEEEGAKLSQRDEQDVDSIEEGAEEQPAMLDEEGQLPPQEAEMAPEGEEDKILDEEQQQQVSEEGADEAMDEFVDAESSADEDIDLDGAPDEQEQHGRIEPSQDDLDSDGDVEHEEAMASAAGEEESYSDDSQEVPMEEEIPVEGEMDEESGVPMNEEISEEIPMEDEEMGEEMPMEEVSEDGEIADSIAGEMGEEMPMEEEGMEEGQDHESLKTVIYDSLQSFRQHRDHLESISQENPELYQALIFTLQAMVQMAKELGYGDVEAAAQEEETMMEEESSDDMLSEEDETMDFGAEEEGEEVPMEEDGMEEESEDEDEDEDEKENPFEKNESFVKLMKKMNDTISQLKLAKDEKENMQELKEKVKKDMAAKKGGFGKKRKLKSKSKKSVSPGSKEKSKKKGGSDGSFCAKSNVKMKSSGKDCRANEDKDSPICSARKKFNCRGKNAEKGGIHKSEELVKFLSNKRKK